MLVGLIHAALFKSIVRYIDDSWRAELVDFYFSFRQRLLDNQRKFATAILDAGSSSAPAAKKPSKPTVAKKVAAA